MQPPAALIKKGVHALPCIGDGRQSGTSGSPSILNASPEAAAGGGLALIRTGDKVRIDLKKRTANILISDAELNERRAALAEHGGYHYPASQTPWQEIQREMVDQFDEGMVLKPAVNYQRLAQTMGVPATIIDHAVQFVYTLVDHRIDGGSSGHQYSRSRGRRTGSQTRPVAQVQHDRGDRPCAAQRIEARAR